MALAVVFAGVYTFVIEPKQDRATANAIAAEREPMPEPDASPSTLKEPVLVSVIGDSYTGGSQEGGLEGANWTVLAEADLHSTIPGIRISKSGAGGAGYVQEGTSGTVFEDAVSDVVEKDTALVVFFGSRNDIRESAASITSSAQEAFSSAKQEAPNADLLVVGTPWVDENPPANILGVNKALSVAAESAGATFVDPVDDKWFFGKPDLIGSDGVHPTDAGHKFMAKRMSTVISSALGD
ncbi:SGNH/GDSL hydrolase family protein [Arthrobacter rhombi]